MYGRRYLVVAVAVSWLLDVGGLAICRAIAPNDSGESLAAVAALFEVETDSPLATVAVNAEPDRERGERERDVDSDEAGDDEDDDGHDDDGDDDDGDDDDGDQRSERAQRRVAPRGNSRTMGRDFGGRGFGGWGIGRPGSWPAMPSRGVRPSMARPGGMPAGPVPQVMRALPRVQSPPTSDKTVERRLAEQQQRIEKLEAQLRELQMIVRRMAGGEAKPETEMPMVDERPRSVEREMQSARIENAVKEMRARRDELIKQLETSKKTWMSREQQIDNRNKEIEAGRKEVEKLEQEMRKRLASLAQGQQQIQGLQAEMQRSMQEMKRHAEEAELAERAIAELEEQLTAGSR